ncbi:SIMPL domain-containing protein [Bifidobacterium choloepi]|uniref:DUF541 domain-containing protein n=1 Tax=Bifidobacterium choloepi TaxID=2614131 RepID=A0A6I5MZH4_9BIFI|nr:SIMPL domain-containing protein [Bifidobacterium choloepi]NEG69225.1 DUF541 domain-containing protein [Bifidobacterium choloepi]
MTDNRMITVKGVAKLTLPPDETAVRIGLTGTDADYRCTVEQSAEDFQEVREALEALGFGNDDLKTTRFDISPKREQVRGDDHEWKWEQTGFQYRHDAVLVFNIDNEKLGQVLHALSQCESHPAIDVDFGLHDEGTAKDLLITTAVHDAARKAQALAKAADVTLGEIADIEYSWTDIEFRSTLMSYDSVPAAAECFDAPHLLDMDITPDDIKVSDSVVVRWRIE